MSRHRLSNFEASLVWRFQPRSQHLSSCPSCRNVSTARAFFAALSLLCRLEKVGILYGYMNYILFKIATSSYSLKS